jgi:hypothetical protein
MLPNELGEANMPDIERRLRALEKRVVTETEWLQALKAHIKALSLVIDCIGAPLCAANPAIVSVIVRNLKSYEKRARVQNEHDIVLWQLRETREFFEGRLPKEANSASVAKSPRKR